jgi:hypothetical protein
MLRLLPSALATRVGRPSSTLFRPARCALIQLTSASNVYVFAAAARTARSMSSLRSPAPKLEYFTSSGRSSHGTFSSLGGLGKACVAFFTVVVGTGLVLVVFFSEKAPFTGRWRVVLPMGRLGDALEANVREQINASYGSKFLPRNSSVRIALIACLCHSSHTRLLRSYIVFLRCPIRIYIVFALQAVLLVSSVAHQLIRANDLGGRDWKIVVIDDPSLNAFVTPGGMVCVFTGLLSTLRTRDQLAAVISHEMGHAIARHAHESITASLITTEIVVFLTLVLGIPFSAIRMAKLVSPDSLRFDLHHSRYRSA